jgi:hypothetical protein
MLTTAPASEVVIRKNLECMLSSQKEPGDQQNARKAIRRAHSDEAPAQALVFPRSLLHGF